MFGMHRIRGGEAVQEFVRVASTEDLAPGQIMLADVDDKRIMLVNVDGQYYALQEECTHAACPLSEGNLEGQVIECPCHGSEFDVTTGVALTPPANEPLAMYAVRVEDDNILVGPAG